MYMYYLSQGSAKLYRAPTGLEESLPQERYSKHFGKI